MRNLKKILALVLALVMSMSLVSVAGAKYSVDEVFNDANTIGDKYLEAVSVLNGIDVFKGDEKGNFNPKGDLRRAELAVIIYRMRTGDVDLENVGVYEDMNAFTDLEGFDWAVGAINYCYNAGIIAGRGNGIFDPGSNVIGYDAILMLLRAIGWDANGESKVAADYRIDTASMAQYLGWLGNIDNSLLGKAITREVVAQITFSAIQTRQLNWLLSGYDHYVDLDKDIPTISLGQEFFGLAYDPAVKYDVFGRPFHVWYIEDDYDADGEMVIGWNPLDDDEVVVAYDWYEAVATYYEATSECDVAEDLGIDKAENVPMLWVNGENVASCDEFDGTINANRVKDKVGAQGRMTEIFEVTNNEGRTWFYVMVMTDEFFAVVEDVTELKLDTKNHIDEYAALYLTVYDNGDQGTAIELLSTEDWDYIKGDTLLIKMTTDGATTNSAVKHDPDLIKGEEFQLDYEIVETEHESIEAKQTDYSTTKSHWVGGEEILDAVRFELDEADTVNLENHEWFFDTYGNLIAARDVASKTDYAVIKTIKWYDRGEDLEDGYAKATLVDLNGDSTTKTIYSIDGNELYGVEGENPNLATGALSSSTQKNKAIYANKALYKVTESAKGLKLVAVDELDGAKAWPGVPALTAGMNATNETVFLVWTGAEYLSFTGIKNIPTKYNSAKVFSYVDKNDDKHAEIVFISEPSTDKAPTNNGEVKYHTFFAYTTDKLHVKTTLGNNEETVHTISGGLVDGAEGTLVMDATTTFKADILANQGKLMRVGINTVSKKVVSVEVVSKTAQTVEGGMVVYAGLAQDLDANGKNKNTLVGGVLSFNNHANSYDVEGVVPFSYNNRNLDWNMKRNDEAHLFLVYTVTANEEKLVTGLYITDQAGAPAKTPDAPPTTDPIQTLIDAVDAATKKVNEAMADVAALAPAALNEVEEWTFENKYTKAYDALVAAEAALIEALEALNEAWSVLTAEAKATYTAKYETAKALGELAQGKVATANENLTVYAVTEAVAAVNAAKKAEDEDALAAAYLNAAIASELATNAGTTAAAAKVYEWTTVKGEAETVVGLAKDQADALEELPKTFKAAVEAAIGTAGFTTEEIAVPGVDNTTAFAEAVLAVTGENATGVTTIKAAFAIWTAEINKATSNVAGLVATFDVDAIAQAYVNVFAKAALKKAQDAAVAVLESAVVEYVKEEADYVYLTVKDADILKDTDVKAALTTAKELLMGATDLVDLKAKAETVDGNLASAAAIYVTAQMADALAAAKKVGVATINDKLATYDSATYKQAEWNALEAIVNEAVAKVLAVTEKEMDSITGIAAAAVKALGDKADAIALTNAKDVMSTAVSAVEAKKDSLTVTNKNEAGVLTAVKAVTKDAKINVEVTTIKVTADVITATVKLTHADYEVEDIAAVSINLTIKVK